EVDEGIFQVPDLERLDDSNQEELVAQAPELLGAAPGPVPDVGDTRPPAGVFDLDGGEHASGRGTKSGEDVGQVGLIGIEDVGDEAARFLDSVDEIGPGPDECRRPRLVAFHDYERRHGDPDGTLLA